MATILVGAPMEEAIVIKARRQLRKQFGVPVSQAAMLRMLIGLYGEGRIQLEPEDLVTYSPTSFKLGSKQRLSLD